MELDQPAEQEYQRAEQEHQEKEAALLQLEQERKQYQELLEKLQAQGIDVENV